MSDAFRSQRLVYRAVESPEDDDFFHQLNSDPIVYGNANPGLLRPQSRKDATESQKHTSEESLLGVVICLQSFNGEAKSTPIGVVNIHHQAKWIQHRHGTLGIQLLKDHQGQGYGSEAIRWALDWAFNAAGLHRVNILCFEWNFVARKLYEKMGLKHEGTTRELFWHDGRFWDEYRFGVLDREWKEMQA